MSVVNESLQGATPAKAANLSTASESASVAKELIIFMTRAEVEAILKKKRKKLLPLLSF